MQIPQQATRQHDLFTTEPHASDQLLRYIHNIYIYTYNNIIICQVIYILSIMYIMYDQSLIFTVLLSTDDDVVDSFARLVLNMKWFCNSIVHWRWCRGFFRQACAKHEKPFNQVHRFWQYVVSQFYPNMLSRCPMISVNNGCFSGFCWPRKWSPDQSLLGLPSRWKGLVSHRSCIFGLTASQPHVSRPTGA